MKWMLRFVLALLLVLPLGAMPVEDAGARWASVLDAMDVEHRWLAGEPIHWRTGAYNEKSTQESSHCSAFAAAACERAGVYLLRPPEHKQTLLANAQALWLGGDGRSRGWEPVSSAMEAQQLANRGWVVLASYRNPDEHRPGHIAVVRPSDKADALIESEGPQITQAGQHNYASASLKKGFAQHRGAFANGEIRFYAHAPKDDPVR